MPGIDAVVPGGSVLDGYACWFGVCLVGMPGYAWSVCLMGGPACVITLLYIGIKKEHANCILFFCLIAIPEPDQK